MAKDNLDKCGNCGTEVVPRSRFCTKCKASKCKNCGNWYPPDPIRYCPHCGKIKD